MSQKVTKVSIEGLKQMISEQATKYRKELNLQKQREKILSELKKIEEDENPSKDSNEPKEASGKVIETMPERQRQSETSKKTKK